MMKKYLMFGLAALAFASCNKTEFEPYTPEQIVEAKYNQAFIQTFGQPAANHTWGFGTTRAAINVNGNMWESCPSLGATEDADVTAYVRALTTYPKVAPTGLVNYYVTQVHCGTDTYTDLDNHSGILGSSQMNHLMIAMQNTASISDGALSGDWEHINNFNRGNNTDWNGNTLVTDGGTFDFAYLGSEDSKYHNRWIAIDGKDVPKTGGGNYAGNYYVCFDFEATNDGVQTNVQVSMPNPERETEIWTENYTFDGAYTAATLAGTEVNFRGYTYTLTAKNTTVTQYVGGNKVVIGDNDYTDWIVRLVKAEPKVTYDGRIMGEDLSASEGSDFDFNDVVFDFKITSTGAKILLQAAGGTLPLKIGGTAESNEDGFEVHELFKVNTNIMVNTAYDASPKIVTRDAVPFELEGTFADDGSDIPVFVKKDGKWMPLTARRGNPASKFRCETTTKWVDEYISIELAYPKFSDWVKDPSVDWESDVVEKYVNLYINRPNDNKAVATE